MQIYVTYIFICCTGVALMSGLAVISTSVQAYTPTEATQPMIPSTGTILFQTGFEQDKPAKCGWNGSIPPDCWPKGWCQMDVDGGLSYPGYRKGVYGGDAAIYIVESAADAYDGKMVAKTWSRYRYRKNPKTGESQCSMCNWLMWGKKPVQPYVRLLMGETGDRTVARKVEYQKLYARWYQKFESFPQKGDPANPPVEIFFMLGMKFSDETKTRVVSFRMATASVWILNENTIEFRDLWDGKIGTKDASQWYAGASVSAPVKLETNKWYCFEVWYKSDPKDGEFKLWLDGEETLSFTGNTTPPKLYSYPDTCQIGAGGYHTPDDVTSTNYISWIDCIVIADYRVGPERVSPEWK